MAARIRRAIVDAASVESGSLSGRLTATRYLMPIANLPLICHVLAELSSGGIEEARIVTCNGVRTQLERLVGTGQAWSVRVSYDEVEEGHGREAVQSEIHDAVSEEPVLVYPGDCLFPGKIQQMRERFC